jgi:hypothetical protein
MKTQTVYLALGLALALPFGAAQAQSPDAAYCQALTASYTTYVRDQNDHRPSTLNVGVTEAIARCQAGDTSGIPTIEQALTNAAITLPPRG